MLSVYGVIFHLFQEILTKKQMAEAEEAEADAGWSWDGNFSSCVDSFLQPNTIKNRRNKPP